MNTVLEDNKKLCLNIDQIIQLAKTTNLIFELMDLEQASPATVSACKPYLIFLIFLFQVSRYALIYMEPTSLGRRAIFTSWFNTLPVTLTDNHKKLFIE